MQIDSLMAVSPIDGRYYHKTEDLTEHVSEYALIRLRVLVEIRWLEALSQHPNISNIMPLEGSSRKSLNSIIERFSLADAKRVKEIEKTTNHDVKAVEYFLKEKFQQHLELSPLAEFIHFACTSEDINNIAYALMLKHIRSQQLLPKLTELVQMIRSHAHELSALPMLARTHGQSASPTTMGKELANTVARLERQLEILQKIKLQGKINGAVGNFNAHYIAYPQVNWPELAQDFIQRLELHYNPYTTQIEPHDFMAEYFHCCTRINTILIDLCRDIWGYISLGYFSQKILENEVGSSTMPHKVNPIDFENAEGNLGLANALLNHLAAKLPVSRWQRDLSDSTVLRSIGTSFGHCCLAYHSLIAGIAKLQINQQAISADLNENWEVLAEALQTVMRAHGIKRPYEQVKALTRGKQLSAQDYLDFVDRLAISDEAKQRLKTLRPETYIGNAAQAACSV